MAPRANWKGYLKVGELSCHVALYTAASTAERVSFNIVNRETGHRVHRQMVDADTGKKVAGDDIVKGYEVASGEYVVLEPEEIKEAVPNSDKTLELETFIPCADVDTIFLDRPYYLAPADKAAADVYALIRKALEEKNVVALARTVLFRRLRTLLIRPSEEGMIATTLNYDYEVRSAEEVFADIPDFKIEGEMLDLARHIISTKKGKFDPTEFDDRYETALAELIRAKIEGRKLPKKPKAEPKKVSNLLDALRQSAGAGSGTGRAKKTAAAAKPARKPKTRTPQRKAS
ncbi:non-homologous end joining protein Ku [Pseudorhizobium sp. NPDC055634]